MTEHITTPLAPERNESETPQRETSSPPATPATTPQTPAPSSAADETPSPEGGVGEEAAAVAAVASSFPGAAEAETEDEAFTHVLAEIKRAMSTNPTEGLDILKAAMEVATRRRLLTRKVPETNVTLGARLNQLMAKASTAIESQRREAS